MHNRRSEHLGQCFGGAGAHFKCVRLRIWRLGRRLFQPDLLKEEVFNIGKK